MDQNQHGLAAGGGTSGAYGMNQYQSNLMMAAPQSPSQAAASGLPASSSSFMREQQYAHQYMHHLQQQELRNQLQNFWAAQYHEIEQTVDFKNHSLPLARIKKIMKADEDVRMISAEAPVIFSRACEMFILELTLRSWINAEENKRRTLQKNDIAAAITKTDVFDFLVDIVPRDDLKDELLSVAGVVPRVPPAAAAGGGGAGAAENVPYYYMPPQQVVGPPHPPHSPYGAPKVIMGRPVVDHQAHYGQAAAAAHHSFPAQVWPNQQNPSNNNSDS